MKQFSSARRLGSAGCCAVTVLISGLACAVGALRAGASDWPNWRGPNANGSISTGQYPSQWDGTNVQWQASLPGKGSSTPIVWKEHLYLTAPIDGQDGVLAFDLTGKMLWQTKLGP